MAIALVLVGVACIIAAIVGGGVRLRDIQFPTVQSLWRQLMLGGFGLLLAVAGAVTAMEDPPEVAADATNVEAVAADPANATEPSNEAVDPNAIAPDAPSTEASDPNAATTATEPLANENSGE